MVDISATTFTHDAFVGAFTLVAELDFTVLRLVKFERVFARLGDKGAVAGLFWMI